MNEMFSQGGKGSTGILTNKQAVARHFGVKQSEVVYFSVGALLTGYKVIYDKVSQRAYSLPADIGSGVTAISLSSAGVLVHSAGNVDLGALAVTREEYVTLPGSFTTGVTVNTKNELVAFTDGKYRWDGALPKEVPAGSTPTSTGGTGLNAWVSVGDASLRSQLSTTSGASQVISNNGLSIQENIDFLEYANGVRISEFVSEADPINSALVFARGKGLPVIVDTDMTYTNPIVMYSTDRLYCFGAHVLTKTDNATPSLPSVTAPARGGRTTDFNVDAAIIVVHPENGFSLRNVIDGLRINTNDKCDYAIFAPFWAHHIVKNCMFYGFKQGIRTYDAYAHVWEKIYCNYWYAPSGVQEYSDLPCYQVEDPGVYTSGTSGTISNVTSIFYRCAWRMVNREYTTMTSCGGEAVNKPSTSSNVPYTFELINCNDIVLNTPYTENLYGGFFKIVNDNTAVNRGGSTVINGPQAIAGIRGTPTNVGAKLFDVSGNANVTVNGGYMVTAASGYFLDFYKVTGDSYLKFSGTDMRFAYSNIASDASVYDGVMKIESLYPPNVVLRGVNVTGTYTGVVPFNTLSSSDDRYLQAQNTGYVRTAVPGIYEIEAEVSFPATAAAITLAIKSATSATDTGSTLAVMYHSSLASGKTTAKIRYRGRLTSNRYLYVTVAGGNAQMATTSDTTFSVTLC